MEQQEEQQPKSAMLAEVAKNRAEARNQANAKKGSEEVLPAGAAPLEDSSDDDSSSQSAESEGAEEVVSEVEEPKTLIKIGGKEFTSQREAIAYAEELERENEVTKAYNMGIRETLAAQAPAATEAPVEDNFEEKFYSDPKAAIKDAEERATQKAVSYIQAEQRKEKLWSDFLSEYPDLDRKDAERILAENFNTIGKMTDTKAAMKALATQTRAEYQRMAERLKPRSELPQNRGTQAVSTGSGGSSGVTRPQKEEKVLSMSEQCL